MIPTTSMAAKMLQTMQAKAPLLPTKSDALGVHEPQAILPMAMHSGCDFRAIAPLEDQIWSHLYDASNDI